MDRFKLPADRFTTPGTTAYPDKPFEDSLEIYVTQIGERTLVRFDPALAGKLQLPGELDERAIDASELIAAQAEGLKIEKTGEGLYLYFPENGFRPFSAPGDPETRLVDPIKEDEALQALYAASTEEDLDEAEIYVDKPDPVIFGTFIDGKMVAYSSHRIWGENIADIGVLTHPDYRKRGLGKGVVSALCEWHFANDVLPMYRVGGENFGSQGVGLGLGFELMVDIDVLKAKLD